MNAGAGSFTIWQGTGWAAIDPYTGLGAYIIAGGMYYANATAPQVAAGGWSTVPVNMSENAKKMGVTGAYVYDWLKKQNITKDDAAMQAAWELASFFVGTAIGFAVAPLTPMTIGLMLLLIPTTILFGPGIPAGVLIGLSPYPRIGIALSGMSLFMAAYYAKLALDPNGEVYLADYSRNDT